jgi:hypothetical protein
VVECLAAEAEHVPDASAESNVIDMDATRVKGALRSELSKQYQHGAARRTPDGPR